MNIPTGIEFIHSGPDSTPSEEPATDKRIGTSAQVNKPKIFAP